MFSKTELLHNQINAILRGGTTPDPKLSDRFKRLRFQRAQKSLLTKNLLIPVRILPGTASFNDVATGYSLPLEEDVIIYCWTVANEFTVNNSLLSLTQLKIGIDGRDIMSDVAAGPTALGHDQSGTFASLLSGFGACALPCPIRLPKGRRVIIQMSWNPAPPAGLAPQNTNTATTVLLFCFAVKTCLDDDDQVTLEQIRQWIATHEYQEPVLLNSVTPIGFIQPEPFTNSYPPYNIVGPRGSRMFTMSQTRTISAPLLVRAVATNLTFSEMTVKDTRGHTLTPAGWINVRNIGALASAAVGNSYFKLAIPHVLASGAQLVTEHLTAYERYPVNPSGDAAGPGEFATFDQKWLTWAAVTP